MAAQGDLRTHFQAALHVFEPGQGLRSLRGWHAHVLGRSDGGQGVELVVHACQAPGHVAYDLALEQHVKVMGLAPGAEIAHRSAKTAYVAPATLAEHALRAFFQAIDHHTPAVRYGAQQVMELALNGGQVVEDIRVVEFQICSSTAVRGR